MSSNHDSVHSAASINATISSDPPNDPIAYLPANEVSRQEICDEFWARSSLEWLEEHVEPFVLKIAEELQVEGVAIITDYHHHKAHYFAQYGYGGKRSVVRKDAMAAHIFHIQDDPGFIIDDTTSDPHFYNHPQVLGEPYIRFFCCAPLKTPCGQIFGSLEVFDSKPRPTSLELELKMLAFCDDILRSLNTQPAVVKPVPGTVPESVSERSSISDYFKLPYAEPALMPRALTTPRMLQQAFEEKKAAGTGAPQVITPPVPKRFSRSSNFFTSYQEGPTRQSRYSSCSSRRGGPYDLENMLRGVAEVDEEAEYSFHKSFEFDQPDLVPLALNTTKRAVLQLPASQGSSFDEGDTTIKPQVRGSPGTFPTAAEMQRDRTKEASSENCNCRSKSGASQTSSQPTSSTSSPKESSTGASNGGQKRVVGESATSRARKQQMPNSQSSTDSFAAGPNTHQRHAVGRSDVSAGSRQHAGSASSNQSSSGIQVGVSSWDQGRVAGELAASQGHRQQKSSTSSVESWANSSTRDDTRIDDEWAPRVRTKPDQGKMNSRDNHSKTRSGDGKSQKLDGKGRTRAPSSSDSDTKPKELSEGQVLLNKRLERALEFTKKNKLAKSQTMRDMAGIGQPLTFPALPDDPTMPKPFPKPKEDLLQRKLLPKVKEDPRGSKQAEFKLNKTSTYPPTGQRNGAKRPGISTERSQTSQGYHQRKQSDIRPEDWKADRVDRSKLYERELKEDGGKSITINQFKAKYSPKPSPAPGNLEDYSGDFAPGPRPKQDLLNSSGPSSTSNQNQAKPNSGQLQLNLPRSDNWNTQMNVEPNRIPAGFLGKITNLGGIAKKLKPDQADPRAMKDMIRRDEERKKAHARLAGEVVKPKTSEEVEHMRWAQREAVKAQRNAEKAADMAKNKEQALKYARARVQELEAERALQPPRPDYRDSFATNDSRW